MTLTILASVSLLVLVSTARPLPSADDDSNALQLSDAEPPSEITYTIQAVVRSHSSSPEELDDQDINVQLASVEEVQAYLHHVDGNSVKALVHLDPQELHSTDEKEMYDTLQRLELERGRRTPVSDDVLDRLSIGTPSRLSSPSKAASPLATVVDPEEDEEQEQDQPWYGVFLGHGHTVSTTPVLVMVGSCVVSLLALGCIAAVLYAAEILKRSVFTSDTAWSILPRLEKSERELGRQNPTDGLLSSPSPGECDKVGYSEKEEGRLLTAPVVLPRIGRTDSERIEESDDELDEKFFDAEGTEVSSVSSSPYATPLFQPLDLSPPMQMHHLESDMSELAVPGGLPPARPPWSVHAAEAKLPTISDNQGTLHQRSDGHRHRRRAYGANAELDAAAALAMQLRPGMGLGADAAWLVRFVMAVFGWCAVLVMSVPGGPRPRTGSHA